jgi:hypothetical protein
MKEIDRSRHGVGKRQRKRESERERRKWRNKGLRQECTAYMYRPT